MIRVSQCVTGLGLALLICAGGCQKRDEGAAKTAAPSHAATEKTDAAAAVGTSESPKETTAASAPTMIHPPAGTDPSTLPDPLPPEEAVQQANADPGWPAKDAKPVTTSQSPAGAVLEDYVVGTGMPTLPGAAIALHYVARVKDGGMFDSTYGGGRPRYTTTTGLMPALQEAVVGMQKGGKRRVILTPELAYGEKGLVNAKGEQIVPPGATVYFDLELVDLKQKLGGEKDK